MKIVRKYPPIVHLEEFCDQHRLYIEFHKRDGYNVGMNDLPRFYCNLVDENEYHAEVKNGCILSGVSGNGDTETQALDNLATQISGTKIVFGTHTGRLELDVPTLVKDV